MLCISLCFDFRKESSTRGYTRRLTRRDCGEHGRDELGLEPREGQLQEGGELVREVVPGVVRDREGRRRVVERGDVDRERASTSGGGHDGRADGSGVLAD